MSNRVLSVVLAMMLLVSLAACGAKEPPQENSTSPASNSSSAPESSSIPKDLPAGIDPAVAAAVEKAIGQYKSGETPANSPELPEGFLFPETLDWGSVQIQEAENGMCQVLVTSAVTESPRENLFINGPEKAVFCWNGSSLDTVSFLLDRTEAIIPIQVDSDDLVTAAVEEKIAQYNNGTVTVTDNIPALPEGFTFPASLDWQALNIEFNDVTGAFQVAVPSASGEQTATFVCYKFAEQDENYNYTGGMVCHVSYVVFE